MRCGRLGGFHHFGGSLIEVVSVGGGEVDGLIEIENSSGRREGRYQSPSLKNSQSGDGVLVLVCADPVLCPAISSIFCQWIKYKI